jgi:hypothetical protein
MQNDRFQIVANTRQMVPRKKAKQKSKNYSEPIVKLFEQSAETHG